MDVLILAAGLSSRLSKFTHELIPKYLIDIDGNNGLYYLIKYWSKYGNNIYLVINSKYNDITNFYIQNILYEHVDKIKIINYNSSDGTAYTLNYILNNNLKNENIQHLLLTWCDLYPIDVINFKKLNKTTGNNIHIFTHGNKCRYALSEKNEIINVEKQDGNIIGIYYFQNFKRFSLETNCINNDIVIYLNQLGNICNFPLNNIIDYGDEEKMLNIIELKNNSNKDLKCRYFNSIDVVDENKLMKRGINDKGKEIINFEKEWYKYVISLNNNKIDDLIPKIYNIYESAILMEYKAGFIPVYQFMLQNETNKELILQNIMMQINKLHNIEKINIEKYVHLNNLKKEIYDKVIDRKKIIEPLLNYFRIISTVNNVKIDTFENILNKCKNIIIKYYEMIDKCEYSIIAGDCQFSNILINPNNISEIVFIDPRGYFGNTKIHGPIEYDYAKILYAISGYDKFNNNYFNIKNINEEEKCIEFNIEGIFFEKNIINKYFNKVHKAYLVIIWLSLAEYNKNNIWKCLASYYYGLYLGTIL